MLNISKLFALSNNTCINGITSITMVKLYLNKHMQHLCFEVMFRMFRFHVTLIITCDYECKMVLMLMIWNANACLTPGVLKVHTIFRGGEVWDQLRKTIKKDTSPYFGQCDAYYALKATVIYKR
jgi:hypothetical protein